MKPLPLKLVLTDEQLIALGQITAQWSFLESEIAQHAELTARIYKVPVPEDHTFEGRMKAWRAILREIKIPEAERTAILAIAKRISDMQGERHRTIHARWALGDDGQPIAFGDRFPNVFEWKLSTEKLWKVARKISQLNVDLGALPIPSPVGKADQRRKPSSRRLRNP